MDIEKILNGGLPTLDEYAELVDVCERLPDTLLYKLITKFPDMHWSIKNVANDQLRNKIQQKNMDRFNEALFNDITNRLV